MSKSSTAKTSVKTLFACKSEDALTVFLAGDFNDWNRDATALKKGKDGRWIVNLDLPPGRYEFKFIIDGEWCCDPGCDGGVVCPRCVSNEFGTMNRYVEVQS